MTARGVGPLLALTLALGGCASVRMLDANHADAPLLYAGTRLDHYALQGGCCPQARFGALPPAYPGLDLPASVLLDTLLAPFALAAELGISLGVRN